ncbi:hypothetical protein Tco_1057775 [Tanacetum coccineum]|uniref:Uncharacterized protein n=1 Tax=Tanacetum coccineum TaxID=301880 RepID=A0ABQ5H6C2_9ASTR
MALNRRPEHVGEDHQVDDKARDDGPPSQSLNQLHYLTVGIGGENRQVAQHVKVGSVQNGIKTRLLIGQDGDHTMTSSNTSNIKELDGMLRMDACYLELKVPSRSRRDGSCDFLNHYGYHYGDAIARPLLPSEVPDVDTSASSIAFQIKDTCNGQRRYDHKGHGSGLVNKKARVKDSVF